jgi:hypothetical protein
VHADRSNLTYHTTFVLAAGVAVLLELWFPQVALIAKRFILDCAGASDLITYNIRFLLWCLQNTGFSKWLLFQKTAHCNMICTHTIANKSDVKTNDYWSHCDVSKFPELNDAVLYFHRTMLDPARLPTVVSIV